MNIARALKDYVAPWRESAFEPGKVDCAQFARGWVRLVTGQDVGGDVTYTTLADGVRTLRDVGIRDHIALAAQTLPEVHPAFAQEGDIAVVSTGEGDALAILAGEIVYALDHQGLRAIPRSTMTRAFACRP